MNVVDIIIIIPFVWAIYKGFSEGIARQLGGIAGVIAGIWLGFRYGITIGNWIDLTGETARIVGFIIIVVAAIICGALIGKLLGGVFKLAGLQMLDTVGGVILSSIKMLLIVSVLLVCFHALNGQLRLVKQSTISKSALYEPVMHFSGKMFPIVEASTKKLLNGE